MSHDGNSQLEELAEEQRLEDIGTERDEVFATKEKQGTLNPSLNFHEPVSENHIEVLFTERDGEKIALFIDRVNEDNSLIVPRSVLEIIVSEGWEQNHQ